MGSSWAFSSFRRPLSALIQLFICWNLCFSPGLRGCYGYYQTGFVSHLYSALVMKLYGYLPEILMSSFSGQ